MKSVAYYAKPVKRSVMFFNTFLLYGVIQMEKVIVGALIAVIGWLVAHFSKLHFEKRSARLNRINDQLKNLYGPLMATLTANNETWEAFTKKHWPSHGLKGYFGKGADTLSEEELSRWRTWMVHVFHPLNERIEKVIIENIHLIEGDEIPDSFTKPLSHVSAYRAVKFQWDKENYSEYLSVNNWPTQELLNDVKPIFLALSHEQSKLLGKPK